MAAGSDRPFECGSLLDEAALSDLSTKLGQTAARALGALGGHAQFHWDIVGDSNQQVRSPDVFTCTPELPVDRDFIDRLVRYATGADERPTPKD